MDNPIVAAIDNTFIVWNNDSTYNVYQDKGEDFISLDTFEHYPTFGFAHAQMVADCWFNDSFSLED